MANTIELRDPQSIRKFTELAESIKATTPEALHPAIFTRLIVATRGMSVSDPVNTPLSIWTIDLDALKVILALRNQDLSTVSHINPITMIDALKGADPSKFLEILSKLSGSDLDFPFSPKEIKDFFVTVGKKVGPALFFLNEVLSAGQNYEWLKKMIEDNLH